MGYSDHLNGILRFDPWLLALNVALIFHFFISWYFSAKKTGWIIDFWHVSLFLTYFVTCLLLYPFATAKMNSLVIGSRNLEFAKKSITMAYLLSLIGYLSIFTGGAIFKYYNYRSPIYTVFLRPIKMTLGETFKAIVSNRMVSRFVCYFYFFALAIALFFAYKGGMGNNPRGFYALNEQYRFLYNFVNALSGIVSGLLVARIFQFNHRIDKFLFVLFIIVTVFIGSRGGVIGPILAYFTSYVYFNMKGKIKVTRILSFVFVMLVLILGLSFFRAGSFSFDVLANSFLVQIFYGNSFSDLRDFSWTITMWPGDYFYGKTYLAAFISFIPSSISSFRTEWSIGKVTATMAGYDPKEHPGLRPGLFGESFLNFGVLGIIVLGILLGFAWKYVDHKIKEASYSGNRIEAATAGIATMFISSLPITAGFFGIYVTMVVFFALYLFRLFLVTYKKSI
jgi:oligosaccharide repeat unit polymerase